MIGFTRRVAPLGTGELGEALPSSLATELMAVDMVLASPERRDMIWKTPGQRHASRRGRAITKSHGVLRRSIRDHTAVEE